MLAEYENTPGYEVDRSFGSCIARSSIDRNNTTLVKALTGYFGRNKNISNLKLTERSLYFGS